MSALLVERERLERDLAQLQGGETGHGRESADRPDDAAETFANELDEGMEDDLRASLDEVAEARHAEPGGSFEQEVEQFGGGHRIVEGAVSGSSGEAEMVGKGAEPTVRHLVAHQPPGEPEGVDDGVGEGLAPAPAQGCVQESEVEADVVADDHGVADELLQRGEDGVDARRGCDHAVGDPGQQGDGRWDGATWIDQRGEGAEEFAAADLDRTDLGDAVAIGGSASGFQVDDDECGL